MNKLIKVLTLVLALVAALTFTAFADEDEMKAAAYLSEYYGIELGEDVDLEDINAAFEKLGVEPVETEADVYEALCKIANCEALALSYIHDDAPDKAVNTLTEEGIEVTEEDMPYAHFVACLLDLEVIDDEDDDFAEVLLRYIKDNGGYTELNDKSAAEDIYDTFGVSKKTFKKAVGDLYKRRLVVLVEGGIQLA